MSHTCEVVVGKNHLPCGAPATKLYGQVWACDPHYEEANYFGDEGFSKKLGTCIAITGTDFEAPDEIENQ